jgi:hypothetical protein
VTPAQLVGADELGVGEEAGAVEDVTGPGRPADDRAGEDVGGPGAGVVGAGLFEVGVAVGVGVLLGVRDRVGVGLVDELAGWFTGRVFGSVSPGAGRMRK